MSYEAMPCVLKNEDGTPMYGLLIKPLQNQVVFQLAPNQQQQHHQQQQFHQHQSAQQHQSMVLPSLQPVITVPSSTQMPSTSNWSGGASSSSRSTSSSSATPQRRHYATILPRGETTPSTSSRMQSSSSVSINNWNSPTTHGNIFTNCAGAGGGTMTVSNNNGFATLIQSKTPPNTAVKFAYTSVSSASPLSTPPLMPFMNGSGQQTPAAFTQALSAYGLISSSTQQQQQQQQPVLETIVHDSTTTNSTTDFANVFGEESDAGINGERVHSLDTSTSGGVLLALSSDCAGASTSSIDQNNFVVGNGGNTTGGCSSTDLDSLLRDIDLSEITNSLMPLLENAEMTTETERSFQDQGGEKDSTNDNGTSSSLSSYDAAQIDAHQGAQSSATAANSSVSSSSSRPPCRYQGLLSNTSNLRVGSNPSTAMAPSGGYSLFDQPMGTNSDGSTCSREATSGGGNINNANPSNQTMVQAQTANNGGGEYDHALHEATTPDSGIQSMGDSPHAVPQSSPMQFFSASPDARRRRTSANGGGAAAVATVVPQIESPPQAHHLLHPPPPPHHQLSGFHQQQSSTAASTTAPTSALEQQIAEDGSRPSGSWTNQKYMHPLCVNTTYFEPISECESSPTVRVPENSTASSRHFPSSSNTTRCYSPSTTSSDCGNEPSSSANNRRSYVAPSTRKRTRRTRKRGNAGNSMANSSGADFDDMPVLQPEELTLSLRPRRPPQVESNSQERQQTREQVQESKSGRNGGDEEQLTLNVSDSDALVEKLLSVVPKEQLASLRRRLDERLGGGRDSTTSAGNRNGGDGGALGSSETRVSRQQAAAELEKTLSMWQSKNGYASDTSDISSITIGSQHRIGGGKKNHEEEGDSATTSRAARYRGMSQSSQSSHLRRSSVSSSGGMAAPAAVNTTAMAAVEPKKEDPLKKLMEYRAKVRSNCIKPSVGTRVNELIPSFIQLRMKTSGGGDESDVFEFGPHRESLSTAFTRIRNRLAVMKEAPKLTRETDPTDLDKQRTAAFNNLQNLETEASDDEDDDVDDDEAPALLEPECSLVSSTRPDPIGHGIDTSSSGDIDTIGDKELESTSPAAEVDQHPRKKTTTREKSSPRESAVQVNDNPQRRNISVKINLSLLRGRGENGRTGKAGVAASTSSTESEKRTEPSSIDESRSNADRTADNNNDGKKRAKSDAMLPLKKRFKDDASIEERKEDGRRIKEKPRKDKETDERRKRRSGGNEDNHVSKKPKLAKELVVVLEPLVFEHRRDSDSNSADFLLKPIESPSSSSNLDESGKSKGNKDTMRLFRRCNVCKTWLRVEDKNGPINNDDAHLCSKCCSEKVQGSKQSAKTSKPSTVLRLSKKAITTGAASSKKTDGGGKVSTTKTSAIKTSTNRTVKATSGTKWRYPRKTYLKGALFHDGGGSSSSNEPSQSNSLVNLPDHCRLLGNGAESGDFNLPYDVWYHHSYQKNLMRDNPAQNYRKIRSNIYVDIKAPTGLQQHVCNCKMPSNPLLPACGDDCLNRMMFTECVLSSCPCGDVCKNNRFQKRSWAPGLEVFDSTTAKGMGVKTKLGMKEGSFICEYLGEVVTTKTFGERMATRYKDCTHHYALNLDNGLIIDGYRCGSVARFINHSCEPNCEIQKWLVNGQYRIGVFALRDIKASEELTYNYKFRAFNRPQACLCGAEACRGFVDEGGKSSTSAMNRSAHHQARKSTPKPKQRSDTKEDHNDSSPNKLHLLKPLSHRERCLVLKGRIFLLRNVDGLRKKLQALNASNSESSSTAEDERRKAEIISSQLTALKTSRSVRTRRSALSEEDVQMQKLTGLVQLLKSVLRTLDEAEDKDGRPLLTRFKKSRNHRKQFNDHADKSDGVDFGVIERNVEKGLYRTPELFDQDVKTFLNQLRNTNDESTSTSSDVDALDELWRTYERAKASIGDQLKDALGFQLTADFVRIEKPTKKNDGGTIDTGEHIDDHRRKIDEDPAASYWSSDAPFVCTKELGEEECAELWSTKADSYDEQDDKVHCICGISEEDGMMIQCDQCRYWQHNDCVGVSSDVDEYVCEFCTSTKLALFKDVIMSPQPEIRFQNCVYYRSLMKNGLQVRVGECIYVKKNIDEKHKQLLKNFNRQCVQGSNQSTSSKSLEMEIDRDQDIKMTEPEDRAYRRSELRVFRVERLFTGPRDVKFVFGYYFARPHETFCEPSRRFYRNEIFVTPLYDTLPLDAVVGRCLVLDVQSYCKGRPKCPKYAEDDVYICEYRLDKAQRLFDKMHARNRYPVSTKPYIFQSFAEKPKVKRDFTPFAQVATSKTAASTSTKKNEHSKKKTDPRSESKQSSSDVSEKRKILATKKQNRVEHLIDKLIKIRQ